MYPGESLFTDSSSNGLSSEQSNSNAPDRNKNDGNTQHVASSVSGYRYLLSIISGSALSDMSDGIHDNTYQTGNHDQLYTRTEQLKKLGNDYFLPRRLNHNRESSYAAGTCQTALQPGATRESGTLSHLSLRSGNKVARL